MASHLAVLIKRSDYFTGKVILQEKKSIALYSSAHALFGVYG